jgi:thiamine-monophosphate kinase
VVAERSGRVELPLEWLLARKAAAAAGVPRQCVEAEACLVGGVLVSIDGYSARESKPKWLSWRDWGWRAVVAALSDVIASGGDPVAVMVSLGVRRPETALEIMEGVGESATRYGVVVASGDLNKAESEEWIDVAVVGRPLKWVRRVGAKPGDAVFQIGELGYGGLAQAVTEGRIPIEALQRGLVERISKPSVNKGFEVVAKECDVKASIDNSDGWAYSLMQLAAASGVSINLTKIVVAKEVEEVVEEFNLGPVDVFGLKSWEDYNIAAVVDRARIDCVQRYCERLELKCWLAGEVIKGSPGLVTYKGKEVKVTGWSSFNK